MSACNCTSCPHRTNCRCEHHTRNRRPVLTGAVRIIGGALATIGVIAVAAGLLPDRVTLDVWASAGLIVVGGVLFVVTVVIGVLALLCDM